MKIQVYDDDNMARVFDREGNGLCDIWPRGDGSLSEVDASLRNIRMRRVGDWKRYRSGGFYEASVRFDAPRRAARPSGVARHEGGE